MAPALAAGVESPPPDLTDDQIRAETIAIERAAVKAHGARYCEGLSAMIAKGQISADTASELTRRVTEFVEGVTIGLHMDAVEHPAVRVAVRAALGVGHG